MDEIQNRTIKLVKGQELNIHISDDICDPQSFMYPACHQAAQALGRIIEQTRFFHQSSEYASEVELADNLFQYSGNVIMFDAPRGGGKTHTMLSFSRILSECSRTPSRECWHAPYETTYRSFLETHHLTDCRFLPLSPIEPAALEGDQNILYVVLSRLVSYAESLLLENRNHAHIKEQERSELFEAVQRCLSGINGIKRPQKDALDSITSLIDISDGTVLRKYFYNLVQQILKIAASCEGVKNSFLILQLDDVDSQISCGYQVLEDVRKYLVIPNLVILISADSEMLYHVILQGHYAKFPNLLGGNDASLPGELSRTCRKYIDKLIPPSHMVHLPQMDKYIEVNGNRLDLKYVQYKDGSINQEMAVKDWANGDGWNLQNTLLMLIYRKTGVVFVAPSWYLHNIIPRTLRGLNQLVYLLTEMEDIPLLDMEKIQTIPDFAKELQKQIRITEENLSRFVDYFTHEWIGAKIKNLGDRAFLREFCKTVGINRVRLAMKYLQKYYPEKQPDLYNDRMELDTRMTILAENNRTEDDFLLFFSIRTLMSLESHRLILLQKKKTLHDFFTKKKNGGEIHPIVFDFDPDQMILPKSLLVSEAIKQGTLGTFKPTGALDEYIDVIKSSENYEILKKEQGQVLKAFRINDSSRLFAVQELLTKEITVHFVSDFNDSSIFSAAWDIVKEKSRSANGLSFFGNTMVNRKVDGSYSMNCLNLVTFMLRLGNGLLEAGKNEDKPPEKLMEEQRYFYRIQETALLVAANWDIQEQIRKRLILNTDQSIADSKLSCVSRLLALYSGIDMIISKINGGKFEKYIKAFNGDQKLSMENAYRTLLVDSEVTLSVNAEHLNYFFEIMFDDKLEGVDRTEPKAESGNRPPELMKDGAK